MEQLRQNVTYDEILDMKVVDVGGEGRWISLFDADTPSVSMEAKKIFSEISPLHQSMSLVAIDGCNMAQGLTGMKPPTASQGSSGQVWLWTSPVRRQNKRNDPPTVMFIEVSGLFQNLLSGDNMLWLQLTLMGCSSLVQEYTSSTEDTINKIWAEIYSQGIFRDMKNVMSSMPQLIMVLDSPQNSKKSPKARFEAMIKHDDEATEAKNLGSRAMRELTDNRNAINGGGGSEQWGVLKDLLLLSSNPRSFILPSSMDEITSGSMDDMQFKVNGFHLNTLLTFMISQLKTKLPIETLKLKLYETLLVHLTTEAQLLSKYVYHCKAVALGIIRDSSNKDDINSDDVGTSMPLPLSELWLKIDECFDMATLTFHQLLHGNAYMSSVMKAYELLQEDLLLLSQKIEMNNDQVLKNSAQENAQNQINYLIESFSKSSSSLSSLSAVNEKKSTDKEVEEENGGKDGVEEDFGGNINWAANVEAVSLGIEQNDSVMMSCNSILEKLKQMLQDAKDNQFQPETLNTEHDVIQKHVSSSEHNWECFSTMLYNELLPFMEEPVNVATINADMLKTDLEKRINKCKKQEIYYNDRILKLKSEREATRSACAVEQGEIIRIGERSKQEILRELQEVEMELSEVESRSERVEVLRKKKVSSATTRANDARRRAVLMNAKVAEIQAVSNAKVDSSQSKSEGMESMALSQMELSSLIKERELLEAHAETLEAHLELIKNDQKQTQVKATEVEYQCSQSTSKKASLTVENENNSKYRDELEDLVLKLKLYVLGGINAVKMGRPPHNTLPSKLVAALDSHERQCLDEIFFH